MTKRHAFYKQKPKSEKKMKKNIENRYAPYFSFAIAN